MEARKSRNAGYFEKEGIFYRVNQLPGFSKYGYGVAINRITTLDTECYVEIQEDKIVGGYLSEHTGTHHLNYADGYFALDFSVHRKIYK
jgi:hypothetical protein